jgi:hypothetical protein
MEVLHPECNSVVLKKCPSDDVSIGRKIPHHDHERMLQRYREILDIALSELTSRPRVAEAQPSAIAHEEARGIFAIRVEELMKEARLHLRSELYYVRLK